MDTAKDQDFSLTLKYLLENPALLQPPDSNSKDNCKDENCFDQYQQNDLTSAYLGPQIWSDTLLSDDLKLEPVNLDELLDTTGFEDEMGDLSSLMASPPNVDLQLQTTLEEPPLLSYQDMPSLMSNRRSPNEKQIPASPSVYFHYPPSNHNPEKKLHSQLSKMDTNKNQKLLEMKLFDQQYAILSDIMSHKKMTPATESPLQQVIQRTGAPVDVRTTDGSHALKVKSSELHFSDTSPNHEPLMKSQLINMSLVEVQPKVLSIKSNEENQQKNNEYSSSTSPLTPIDIRIPSPKRVHYVPNKTDVIISTPQDAVSDTPFDPSKRVFTEEELKPQPIIRKSKKVHVPADNKDGKYWSRRTKNNIAAKRSREARRIKENQIAMRANYLEQENAALKLEISELREELSRVVEVVKKYEEKYSIIKN